MNLLYKISGCWQVPPHGYTTNKGIDWPPNIQKILDVLCGFSQHDLSPTKSFKAGCNVALAKAKWIGVQYCKHILVYVACRSVGSFHNQVSQLTCLKIWRYERGSATPDIFWKTRQISQVLL